MRWGGIFDIDGKKIQVEEEQLRTQAPGFWDDQKKAEAQMKLVKDLQKWIDGYNEVKTLADELELSFDFYKEELVTEFECFYRFTGFRISRVHISLSH